MTANVGKNNIWQYAKFKHLAKFNLANAHYQLIAFVHKIETQLGKLVAIKFKCTIFSFGVTRGGKLYIIYQDIWMPTLQESASIPCETCSRY